MPFLEFFPIPFFVGITALALVILRSRRRGWLHLLGLGFFGLYLLALSAVLFFPIFIPENGPMHTWEDIQGALRGVNLVPFRFGSLFEASPYTIVQELAGNILLTIPFGFGICFLWEVSPRRILFWALGAGLALEGMQLFYQLLRIGYPHSVDINDVMLNALGVLAGTGVYGAGQWVLQKTRVDSPA